MWGHQTIKLYPGGKWVATWFSVGFFFFNSFIRTQLCLSIYILSLSPNTLKGQIWGRWYSLNKNCKVCKAEHVYYLAFYKEFASPLARLLWYFEKTPKYCGSKTRPYFFLLVCVFILLFRQYQKTSLLATTNISAS